MSDTCQVIELVPGVPTAACGAVMPCPTHGGIVEVAGRVEVAAASPTGIARRAVAALRVASRAHADRCRFCLRADGSVLVACSCDVAAVLADFDRLVGE